MSNSKKKPIIFSALEVANICGVVNQTAINWIKQTHLKAFKTPGGQYRVYLEDLLNFMQSQDMRIPEQLLDLANTSVIKILVIEKEIGLNNVIVGELKREIPNIETFQATNAFEAGALFAKQKPDVIIFDDLTIQAGVDSLFAQIDLMEYTSKPTLIQIATNKKSTTIKNGVFTLQKPIDLKLLVQIINEN